MKKLNIYLLVVYFMAVCQIVAQNQAPVVQNVRFEQRTDGSFKVDVYYDVNDADGNTMTVTMQVSNDAGTSWNFSCAQISGAVGSGITSGTNKHIVWDFGSEHPEYYSEQIRIKIIADDGVSETYGIPCPGTSTVTYAGKTYNTVLIGSQCWLKENLDVGTKIQGSQDMADGNGIEKYCYDNDESNCDTYGGLYQWNEAMQYVTTDGTQGICPSGWHIPTLAELQTLSSTVGESSNVLKAVGQGSGSGVGTNTSGFSALLAGYRDQSNGSFGNLGSYTYFWISMERNSDSVYRLRLYGSNDDVYFYDGTKHAGFSVRCLKGEGATGGTAPSAPTLSSPANNATGQSTTPTLSWNTSSGATSYTLQVSTNSSFGSFVYNQGSLTSTSKQISGLSNNIKYYWRVSSTNSYGTSSWSSIWSFTTTGSSSSCPSTVNYAGKTYNTVLIGSQCWLKENLDVGTMIQSTTGGYQQTNNSIIEKYCYGNNEANCVTYGGLYEWTEAMQYSTTPGTRGICPSGWHIPTLAELETLSSTVGGSGNALKAVGQGTGSGAGTNISGFSALLAGNRHTSSGSFDLLGSHTYFWSSTENYSNNAYYLYLSSSSGNVGFYNFYKYYGFSVRCLED